MYKFNVEDYTNIQDTVLSFLAGWRYNSGAVAIVSRTKLIVGKTGKLTIFIAPVTGLCRHEACSTLNRKQLMEVCFILKVKKLLRI